MGYKDQFKVGEVISIHNTIEEAVRTGVMNEIVGYENIKGILHIKTMNLGNNDIYYYPAMYAERNLTNYGKKQVVELLWIKK